MKRERGIRTRAKPQKSNGYTVTGADSWKAIVVVAVGLLVFFSRDIYGGIKAKPIEVEVELTKDLNRVESVLTGRVDELAGAVREAQNGYHEIDKKLEGVTKEQGYIKNQAEKAAEEAEKTRKLLEEMEKDRREREMYERFGIQQAPLRKQR